MIKIVKRKFLIKNNFKHTFYYNSQAPVFGRKIEIYVTMSHIFLFWPGL
jgi:hypothetical protein